MKIAIALALMAPAVDAAALRKESRRLAGSVSYSSGPAGDFAPSKQQIVKDFSKKSRIFVPAKGTPVTGFDADNAEYGMGACEQIAFDEKEKMVYAASEQGYINVVNYADAAAPTVTAFGKGGFGSLTDVEVCAEKGIVLVGEAAGTDGDPGTVSAYTTVKATSSVALGTALWSATVGVLPDMILANSDCSIIAVANEGEGAYLQQGDDTCSGGYGVGTCGLYDPQGSVTLITGDLTGASPTVTQVPLKAWTDAELLAKDIHLPLSLNAMKYWSEVAAATADNACYDGGNAGGKCDFTNAIANYDPRMNLEPEYLAWGSDDSTLFVNLQENSAVVTIDTTQTGAALLQSTQTIDHYGLKDWSSSGGTDGIDIEGDGTYDPKFYAGYKTMRNPDAIAAFSVDDKQYIVTANEGDDKEFGKYEEKFKLGELISENKCVFPGFSADEKEKTTDAGFAVGVTTIELDGKVTLTTGDFVCGEYFAAGTTVAADVNDAKTVTLSAGLTKAIPASKEKIYFTSAANGALMTVSDAVNTQAQALRSAASKLSVTVGSSAIDYETDFNTPAITGMVGFGGRGLTIYEKTASGLSQVWDSGSQLEKTQFDNFPWSHNSVLDEEMSCDATYCRKEDADALAAPHAAVGELECATGTCALYDQPGTSSKLKEDLADLSGSTLTSTVDDRSAKDGAGPEAVVIGEACGKLLMVTATEKQGTAFVYEISNPAAPTIAKVVHLNEGAKDKSPPLAYEDGTLGEVDPESIVFIPKAKSPSGNAAVMFGGAWSGTISFWDIECEATSGAVSVAKLALIPIAAAAAVAAALIM